MSAARFLAMLVGLAGGLVAAIHVTFAALDRMLRRRERLSPAYLARREIVGSRAARRGDGGPAPAHHAGG